MGAAKEISVKIIPHNIADRFVKRHHYSGVVTHTVLLHFGVFMNGVLHGVMQFGCPMAKNTVIGLVVDKGGKPAPWNDMLELNRMAFDDTLPKNSESRAISVAVHLIKKYAPHIKWILSFADGTQCGDGTIYRASGFKLTGFSQGGMWELPDSLVPLAGKRVVHRMSVQNKNGPFSNFILSNDGGQNHQLEYYVEKYGGRILDGYMLRYIKILDPEYHLACEEYPYSMIKEKNAGMYKGEKR